MRSSACGWEIVLSPAEREDRVPRYFFHCVNQDRDHDEVGTELPDDAAAHLAAIAYAGEVLKHDPQDLWNSGQWQVEVTDGSGALLFTVVTFAIDAPKPVRLALVPSEPSKD